MCAHQIGDGCRRFNPRSPRGGATHHLQHRQMISKFQSTLPTRGSDAYSHVLALTHQLFQSTLPTRGSDFQRYPLIQPQPAVSIHAPHEGERPAFSAAAFSDKSFNPRSPRGGATINLPAGVYANGVSIHAPHEGERRQYHRTVI